MTRLKYVLQTPDGMTAEEVRQATDQFARAARDPKIHAIVLMPGASLAMLPARPRLRPSMADRGHL